LIKIGQELRLFSMKTDMRFIIILMYVPSFFVNLLFILKRVIIIIIIIIIIVIYLTAKWLSPSGSGYNARTINMK
jgi:hypothetical protein